MKTMGTLVAVIILSVTPVHAEEYITITPELLKAMQLEDHQQAIKDEIGKHVIDECNLHVIHGKNRIDFDPYYVALEALPNIHKKLWREKNKLKSEIGSVVFPIESFATRARIYDAYYALCIGEISMADAEQEILRYTRMPISDDDMSDDLMIHKFYDPMGKDEQRIRRDESRIKVLKRMNEAERRVYIRKKNSSVIQEYFYDIELWKS